MGLRELLEKENGVLKSMMKEIGFDGKAQSKTRESKRKMKDFAFKK